MGLPGDSVVKNLRSNEKTWIRPLGREDPLEKEMGIHSSILAWRIPWTEEPSGLQSMGSQRVGHDWATSRQSLLDSLYWVLMIFLPLCGKILHSVLPQEHSTVNQLHINIYPLFFRFFSHIGHYRVLSRAPYAIQQILITISYLCYI